MYVFENGTKDLGKSLPKDEFLVTGSVYQIWEEKGKEKMTIWVKSLNPLFSNGSCMLANFKNMDLEVANMRISMSKDENQVGMHCGMFGSLSTLQ